MSRSPNSPRWRKNMPDLSADDGAVAREFSLSAGEAYFRRANIRHNAENRAESGVVFVEAKIKI